MVKKVAVGFSLLALAGCNVAPAPRGTGGVDSGIAREDAGGADGGATCPSALAVVCSDFKSTNIAVARVDGTPASGSFVSSGSTPPGLTLALSGDVGVPFVAPRSGRVVLLDRYGTNVVTWMDLSRASVLAQLPVGTGFESNPHDYLEVDATRAYVSRYGTNPSPGQMPYDQGGDLLVVDTAKYTITGRIAMPEENAKLQPCPDTMTWLGGDVVVTLARFSADFSMIGDGRLVGVSPATDAVVWTVDVAGLQNCGRLALSPSGKVAALACSGLEDTATNKFDPARSDVVLFDATRTPPVETKRLGLGAALGSALQQQVSFAGETSLVGLTYGGNATAGDTAFAVDTSSAKVTMLGAASIPYSLAGLRCDPGCSDVCVLGDGEKSVLRRWKVDAAGAFSALADVDVDPTVGLPPRDLGALR